MTLIRCSILLLVCLAGCEAPPYQEQPKPLTDREREARVDERLAGLSEKLVPALQGMTAALYPFLKEEGEFEPRVSRYIQPRLSGLLLEKGIVLVARKDIDRILEEQNFQMTDLFDEDTQVMIGNLAGAKAMILGTVADLSRTVYRLAIRVLDVEKGTVLLTCTLDLPRELLPIKYGGI